MRQLTKHQKKYLDILFKDDNTLCDVESLTYEQCDRLEAMGDTEILWQEANRYLSDKYFENGGSHGTK